MGRKKKVKDGIQVMRAIYYSDETMLDNALENNINIDATNEFGETALMYACNMGNENMVRRILSSGANVNLQNSVGNTPMIYACDRGNEDIVKCLIEYGADINHSSYSGRTALICACSRSKNSLVRYLVEQGADVDCKTREGYTPLIMACEKCNIELVEYLLDNGADVNLETHEGNTPLIIACEKCNFKLVECLVGSGADVNAQNIVFDIPLTYVFKNGITDENVKIVLCLVDNGLDLDVVDTNEELRDFMRKIVAKEPKVGTIIAMRKEGLKGVRKFLKKFVENVKNECMFFLAHSNTAKRIKEENEALEKQLKKVVLDNIKLIDSKKEVEGIIRNCLRDKNKVNETHVRDNISVGSDNSLRMSVHSKSSTGHVIDIDNLKKSNAFIVDSVGLVTRRGTHLKKQKRNTVKHDKSNKKKENDNKKHDNKNVINKGKLSIVDIMNERCRGDFIPKISIVSRMQSWEKNNIG